MSPMPWPLLAHPPLYGWPGYAVDPEPARSTLPPPGDYTVDPGRTTLTVGMRTPRRGITGRTTGVLGRLRMGGGDDAAVVLHAGAADLRTGERAQDDLLLGPRVLDATASPLLHITASGLGSWFGAWVLHAVLHLRGRRVPMLLWLGHAHRLPDGAVAITASGDANRRAAGIRFPFAGRNLRVDLEPTVVPERPRVDVSTGAAAPAATGR